MNIAHQGTLSREAEPARCGLRVQIVPPGGGIEAALALRAGLFRRSALCDRDAYDDAAHHIILVQPGNPDIALATARLTLHRDPVSLAASYTGAHYDLGSLSPKSWPVVELGRLCIAQGCDGLRVARTLLAAITGFCDQHDASFLLGCHSFGGTDPSVHAMSFDLVTQGHLSLPEAFSVRTGCAAFDLGSHLTTHSSAVPPDGLLASYIALGTKFSRHGVVDHDLQRCHLLACLDFRDVPIARRRMLRQWASSLSAGAHVPD